jgi:ferredoxin
MKVTVDHSLCVLTGNCALTAERVFELKGDELTYDPAPRDTELEVLREAEMLCPVRAISVEE